MKNEINAVLENMTTTTPEPEDYTGEDGLLYCGKCRKPKEAYFAPDKALPTPPCGTGLSRTTTAGTRRPGLPAGMWSIGKICGQTISAACSGAA